MDRKNLYKQWQAHPEHAERTLIKRATGELPEMECSKQLAKLISEVYEDGMSILDVGSNVGHYLKSIRRILPYAKYVGIDAYDHYIKQAKEVFKDDNKAQFEVKDIHKPLFPKTPFDIVFCANVLLHLPDFRQPVLNLIKSAKKFVFIRTLLTDGVTNISKMANAEIFDESGSPVDFKYFNTWNKGYFTDFIRQQGVAEVSFVADEFDANVIQKEFSSIKSGEKYMGTKILGGKQVIENILANWTWVKISLLK